MCGLSNKPGCEFDQVVSEGLVAPHQFHGVERVPAIHEQNLANEQGNWYNDDFYWAMHKAQARGQFNPTIVNADMIEGPATGAELIGKIMGLLVDYDVMLVANFILKPRYQNTIKDGTTVLDELSKCAPFRCAMRNGWEYSGEYYEYGGANSRSKTVMGSFIFVQHQKQAMAA
jgi:hypothetical protein